jgi:uncharacterized membrane protein YhaH (DUF805 family)
VESFHTIALRPLRHYADFSGRSRRSDVIAFYIVYAALGFVVSFAAIGFGQTTQVGSSLLFDLAFLCPSLALFVRRLHDSGRSGWWSAVTGPAIVLSFWQTVETLREPIDWAGRAPGPSLAAVVIGLSNVAVLVLIFWNDDPQPNRFGPNPRYDPPERSQLA